MSNNIDQIYEDQKSEVLTSRPLSEEEKFFYEVSYKEPVESIRRLEEVAKFLVGGTSTTSGLFLAAYKLSLSDRTVSSPAWFVPFMCWALSIIFLILVLLPQKYMTAENVPAAIIESFLKARTWKYCCLVAGASLFIGGLISGVFFIIFLPG